MRRGLLREHASLVSSAARLADTGAVLVAGLGAYWLRFEEFEPALPYQMALVLGVLSVALFFPLFGVYRSWRGREGLAQLRSISQGLLAVFVFLVTLAVLSKSSVIFSRAWFMTWAGLAWALVLIFRLALYAVLKSMRRQGWNHRRILLVGAGALGQEVAGRILATPTTGLEVVGFVDDEPSHAPQGPAVNPISNVAEQVERQVVDEVWIALPLRAEEQVKEVLYLLRHSTVTIRFVPDIFGFRLLNHSVTEIAGIPVFDLSVSPMVGLNRLVKALEDRLLALLFLIVASPLALLIAVGIKLTSRGPVLFKQARHGWDGRPIRVYKFRTMRLHHEADGTVTQARRDDDRITPFGRFLRRTSLDELPQLFNVLQGRMSIVGPRPHALAHNERYKDEIDAYMLRHKVKPGITGWAQVNGWRGETDTLEKMKKRVEYDLYYIEHWSLWFDLYIIALTLVRGFVHRNAY